MISFKLIIGLLFALLITGIAVLAVISLRNSRASDEAAGLVKHRHQVLDIVQELASLYKEIQLEGNGFLVTQDSAFLVPYASAKANLLDNIKRLQLLTHDNEKQQRRIDTLLSHLNGLVHFTDSLHQVQVMASQAELADRFLIHKKNRTNVEKVINDIRGMELQLLLQSEKANLTSVTAFHNTFFLMLGGILVLIATTFFSIRYNFNKRIKAEQELKGANDLFKTLFNDTPIGMVISRLKDGVITDCNRAYSQLTNYTPQELVGNTEFSLKLLESKAHRDGIVKNAFADGSAKAIEVQLKPKDRSPIWVSLSTQVIDINNEKHLLSALLDMTAHKELEEKMKSALATEIELNKMKSNFVSLASHEFRTPLTSILSSTVLLDRYSYGEHHEKAAKHVARIKSSVNNLTTILDEFLSISKIEEGKVTPKIEQLNVKDYLAKICNSFNNFSKPGQEIEYEHHGVEEVYTDPVLLGNIVNNLVSNAIKYSDEGKKIFVVSDVNTRLHIEVRDNGIGIPKEEQKHLFNRFFRASNTGTAQGTGLGLHIMKHYVEMLHGHVKVDSEVGKGSTFTVIFEHPNAVD
jgi:PAS domain S-box-containing protein